MISAASSEWFASGYAIGAYRVIEPLGDGGMGMVYVAEHSLIGKRVAVKVLRAELGATPQLIERFFNEARITTSIRHPGIVDVFDFGYTDTKQPYIVMELLEGQSLAARLGEQRFGPLEAIKIARGIASALSAAHARGVVHRDLKPDNVFLVRDPDGDRVKLLDFGIAKLGADPAISRTRTGLLLGTPQYMSPEQCRGASACDHRSDLYSLGCVLFEMVTGKAPFGGDLSELLTGHLHSPPPAFDAPESIKKLVLSLLAKEPARRPSSAAALVRELDALAAPSVIALPSSPPRSWREPLVMGFAVIVGILAMVLAWRHASGRTRFEVPEIPAQAIDDPVGTSVRATVTEAAIDARIAEPKRHVDALEEEVSSDLKKPHDVGVDTPVP